MRPNHLLNVVGAVFILISASGLYIFADTVHPAEGSGGYGKDSQKWRSVFEERTVSGEKQSGDIADSSSKTFRFNFSECNLTSVMFEVRWTDNYVFSMVSPVIVTVRAKSPDGNTSSEAESLYKPIYLEIEPLCQIPTSKEYSGSEGDSYKKFLTEFPANSTFTGEWELEVSVKRDYTSPVHPLSGSITCSIQPVFSYYYGILLQQ